MLWNASNLIGYAIRARDGALGTVRDLYFDEQNWTVRWLVVETGAQLPARRVLLTPFSVTATNTEERSLFVSLSTEQVRNSPDIDTDRPVSHQAEERLLRYYGWTPYWATPAEPSPLSRRYAGAASAEAAVTAELERAEDPYLRSACDIIRYNVHACDGCIGHIADALVDADSWTFRYLIVDASGWRPGKHVLIAPAWLSDIDWAKREAHLSVTRQAVTDSPAYDPAATVDRAYETRLHGAYNYAALLE